MKFAGKIFNSLALKLDKTAHKKFSLLFNSDGDDGRKKSKDET